MEDSEFKERVKEDATQLPAFFPPHEAAAGSVQAGLHDRGSLWPAVPAEPREASRMHTLRTCTHPRASTCSDGAGLRGPHHAGCSPLLKGPRLALGKQNE